ncbi:putative Longin-like domain superfamily protein [Dioscorea sansibarensis]
MPLAASAIYFLNLRGDVLINRLYGDDVGLNPADHVCKAVRLFKSYFGGAFDEDAIRNNFILIYELLDGMFPFLCAITLVFEIKVLVLNLFLLLAWI